MSEVVVRMEMPEDCFECPFGIIDDTEDGVWCNALAQQSSGRREDCPIVCQLPEGHGRLVDADALRIDHFVTSTTTNTPLHRYVSMEQIEAAPTIVPADTAERSET